MTSEVPIEELSRLNITNNASSTRMIDTRSNAEPSAPLTTPPKLCESAYVGPKVVTDVPFFAHDPRTDWKRHCENFKKQVGADSEEGKMARRGFATANRISVYTNYLSMDFEPDSDHHSKQVLYIYEINGIDPSATRPKKKVFMDTMIRQCPLLHEQQDFFVTDDKKKIVSCKDLSLHDQDKFGIAQIGDILAAIEVSNYDARDPNGQPNKTILRLDYSKCLRYDGMNKFVEGQAKSISFRDDGLIEAINIIINKYIQCQADRSSFSLGTNKVYSKNGQKSLNCANKVAIRGYNFSYRSGMGCHLLNVNTATGVFHQTMPVSAYLATNSVDQNDLLGVRVWLSFERTKPGDQDRSFDHAKRRLKTIAGFSRRPAGGKNGEIAYTTQGRNVTVFEHMNRSYGAKTKGTQQSLCVNLGGTDKGKELWFMAEDLIILPYQPFRRDLSADLTSALIKEACRKPAENLSLIANEFVDFLNIKGVSDQKPQPMPKFLQDFGINIYPRLLTVPAYVSKPPRVLYSNNKSQSLKNGTWKLTDQTFVTPGQFPGPAHFLVPGSKLKMKLDDWKKYLRFFHAHCSANGIKGLTFSQLDRENYTVLKDFSPHTLKGAVIEAKQRKAGLVVLLLPFKNKENLEHYALFKQICDQEFGIYSLCLCEDKIASIFGKGQRVPENIDTYHPFAGYARNVGAKLNVRVGGRNHRVDSLATHFPNYNKEGVMILGADVVHPGGKSHAGTPSIAAVVGTIDKELISYRGSARYQQSLEEIILDMQTMARERFEAYKAHNAGNLPTNILYYRDGVDEGRFPRLLTEEVDTIRLAWNAASKTTPQAKTLSKITAVVVTKRHNTRFFPKKEFPKLPNGNCLPGTCVDSAITLPYHFDFYLLSQNTIQGTARPAHYIVLRNEIAFSADQIQNLTNALCYTYARSATPVSYVPAAYYADHLCERAKHYVRSLYEGVGRFGNEREVMREAERLWELGGRKGGNPWNQRLDGTMFWL